MHNEMVIVHKVQMKFGSVANYCKERKISRTRFYQIIKAQKGPSWRQLLEAIK